MEMWFKKPQNPIQRTWYYVEGRISGINVSISHRWGRSNEHVENKSSCVWFDFDISWVKDILNLALHNDIIIVIVVDSFAESISST